MKRLIFIFLGVFLIVSAVYAAVYAAVDDGLLFNPWFCRQWQPDAACRPGGTFWWTESGYDVVQADDIPGDDHTAAVLTPVDDVNFANVWQWGGPAEPGNQITVSFYYRCVKHDEMRVLLRGTDDPGTQVYAGTPLGEIFSCNADTGWVHSGDIVTVYPDYYTYVRVEFVSNGGGTAVTGVYLAVENVEPPIYSIFLPMIAK